MKVVSSSDWRDDIPFETPMIVASVVPGEPTRCSVCGGDSDPRDRAELWAVKHRHPRHHSGYVRFYCSEHLPAIARPEPPHETARARASRERRTPAPRKAPVVERPAVLCPDCFVEVPATGVCGMCGARVS